MKKIVSFCALVGAICAASPALAADLTIPAADGVRAADKPAFSGAYVGVHGGGQFTNINVDGEFDGIGADGLIGGVHAGYNFVMGQVVAGPYIEGGLSNVDVKLGTTDALKQDWYVNGGVLIGFKPYAKTMIFGRLGYEFASWSSDLGIPDADVRSWVVGGGVSTMLTDRVSLGVSADYVIPHEISVDGADYSDLLDASETLRAKVSLSYHIQ